MGSAKQFRKIASDMSWLFSSWAAWFVAIVIVIYFVMTYIVGGDVQSSNPLSELVMRILDKQWEDAHTPIVQGFVSFIFHPSKIFMLVIGVSIVSSFLTFYVKLGVTRKDYYIGTILASIVISLVIVLVAGIVSLVEGIFISNGMGLHQDYAWILLLFVYVLYLITYFTAGWLIGAGFYRYGAGGLLFIVLAVAMIFVFEALWTMELPIAVAGTFVLLSASWFVLRLITKRVRIKLK